MSHCLMLRYPIRREEDDSVRAQKRDSEAVERPAAAFPMVLLIR